MQRTQLLKRTVSRSVLVATLVFAGTSPLWAAEPSYDALLQRLEQLEQRLNTLQDAESAQDLPDIPEAPEGEAATLQAVLDRLDAFEQRLNYLETSAVISEPETVVRQVEVYVDDSGTEYETPVEGTQPVVTYQRERVFRRQNISEEIEDALAAEAADSVQIGVSSVTTLQMAAQTRGASSSANGHLFGLTGADITFLAQSAALNTSFFADVVGIGGSPPDNEISAINLLNGQAARLSNNQLSLREAWLRTELFNRRLGVSVGRLDLTNYFDRNEVANDETSQFISDPLVNNPTLGLSENGLGMAFVYDAGGSVDLKFGVQQSDSTATSLSNSLYKLAEIDYFARPFSLPEGRYRLWLRADNSTGKERAGFGVSVDQKITPTSTLFARYGSGDVGGTRVHFYSGGIGFQAPFTFNPQDRWGIGYAQTEFRHGPNEKLAEAFYNLQLTESLGFSGLLQYVLESETGEGYILPGMRMQVEF